MNADAPPIAADKAMAGAGIADGSWMANAGCRNDLTGIHLRQSAGHRRSSAFQRLALASLLAAASLAATAQVTQTQPEPPTGVAPKALATAKREMVAAGHPLAVEAGLAMLAKGGSAVDAMIATQLVLGSLYH